MVGGKRFVESFGLILEGKIARKLHKASRSNRDCRKP